MSEIRLVRLPSANLLNENSSYYIVKLRSAELIWNGSSGIPESDCETLANSYVFAVARDSRFYLVASKIGCIGSIKVDSRAVEGYHSVCFSRIKAMFCTSCGALLDKGQRHTCNAPRCSYCGEYLSAVEIKNGRTMCAECRAEFVARIKNYHGWHEDPIFQKPDRRSDVLHMGTEIETVFNGSESRLQESVTEISKVANPNPWKHNLRFEHDGTVSVEMITEPKTLKGYIDSNELRSAMETAVELGHHITDACGGHIHIDRTFFGNRHELASAMICYLVGVYWNDFFLPISRRTTTYWCGRPQAKKDDTIIDVYNKNTKIGDGSHNVAINNGNRGTIELRFWCGTLDYDQKLIDLDISRAIATWAKKASCDNLMNAKVSDIFRYIELPESIAYIRSKVTNREILSALPR